MRRRTFLRASGGVMSTAAIAGCLEGLFETESVYAPPPLVEDRPDAVYVPTHIEGMEMAGKTTAKGYEVALLYSFPHRFWIVTGQNRKKVTIQDDDSVHLMPTIWDKETSIIPPNPNLRVEITTDDESVASKSLWPMLSQNMGYHFGDNVALSGDGTYTITVHVGPMDARRTDSLRGKFGEPAEFTFDFEYSQQERDEIMFEELPERKGEKDAVDPMEMEMIPSTQVPPKEQLPGTLVGQATSGDARFIVTRLNSPPKGIDGSGPYLAVSPRTPYNRYPLPFMSLSGTVDRSGNTVFEGSLTPTLDPKLNYHYGTTVDSLQSGDTLTLAVGAPPQIARHEGYEMAFFEMPDMQLTL